MWRIRDSDPSFGVILLDAVNETLFHDSTLYFALISGLLFSLVLQRRGWAAFFKSKLLNVIAPYIIMTMAFTWYGVNADYELAGFFQGGIADYLAKVGENLLSGRAMFQLWYIPILVFLYLSTPLIAWAMAGARTSWLIWPIMLAPLVASRTSSDYSWTTLAYFLGAYAAGMFAGAGYERALLMCRQYQTLLFLTVFLTTAALVASFLLDADASGPISMIATLWPVPMTETPWSVSSLMRETLQPISIKETLWYVQKLAIAGVVLVWLHANEARVPKWIDTLGTYAFPIYFLHGILLVAFTEVQFHQLAPDASPVWVFLAAGFASLVFAVTVSLGLSSFAKCALGRRSRLLVGA